jgi:hypothetical protein
MVAGCLGGCGVLEEEASKSGSVDAQRTRLTLLPLLPPALLSESLVTYEPSLVRAIPTSRVLYRPTSIPGRLG